MKGTFYTLLFCLASINVLAQDNPFSSINKEGQILTLSKGQYPEIHLNDSLQRIGSVVINMNTGKIYKLLPIDSVYSTFEISPTVTTRWYSVDPLAAKYPELNPYNFVANSPLQYKDPDGREIVPTVTKAEDGTIMITLKITAKMVNETIWPVVNAGHMEELKERGTAAITEIYGISGDYISTTDEMGNKVSGPFKVNVIVDLTVASEDNPINECDDVVIIRDAGKIPLAKEDRPDADTKRAGTNVYGYAPENHMVIYISSKTITRHPVLDENGSMVDGRDANGDDSFERVISHEIGHRAGYVGHTNQPPRNLAAGGQLLQSGDQADRGIKLTGSQLGEMIEQYREGNTNNGPQKVDEE